METHIIPPLSGTCFSLNKGDILTVISPEGEQVSDLCAVLRDDPSDAYSSGKTLDYAETIHISTGHTLYSCNDTPLLEIIEDTNGQNDCLLGPCSKATFRHFYQKEDGRIGCLGNLKASFREQGVDPAYITSTFNIFMNVQVAGNGSIQVLPPKKNPGAFISFRAIENLVTGLTACSAEMSNNFSFKPIHYTIQANRPNDQ